MNCYFVDLNKNRGKYSTNYIFSLLCILWWNNKKTFFLVSFRENNKFSYFLYFLSNLQNIKTIFRFFTCGLEEKKDLETKKCHFPVLLYIFAILPFLEKCKWNEMQIRK